MISSNNSKSQNSCFNNPEYSPVITLGCKDCIINIPFADVQWDKMGDDCWCAADSQGYMVMYSLVMHNLSWRNWEAHNIAHVQSS